MDLLKEKRLFSTLQSLRRDPLSTAVLQVKDKIADGETLPAPFEDDFTDLIDYWFDDGVEQKTESEAPKPKKFSHEHLMVDLSRC